jgi:hypothetical protein
MQIVDLADLGRIAFHLGRAHFGIQHLATEKLVVDTPHGLYVRALAQKTRAGEQVGIGSLHDDLPAVAGRGGIRNVVAGRQQTGLCRAEPADADTEDTHDRSTIEPI